MSDVPFARTGEAFTRRVRDESAELLSLMLAGRHSAESALAKLWNAASDDIFRELLIDALMSAVDITISNALLFIEEQTADRALTLTVSEQSSRVTISTNDMLLGLYSLWIEKFSRIDERRMRSIAEGKS